jgi:hypothetical protein
VIILSHRGYWRHPVEKNQKSAFERSFSLGFGTEVDIRDHNGEIVISHDVPNGDELTIEKFFDLNVDSRLPLALNIKADGLAMLLKASIENYGFSNCFVFDMSVPDMLPYLEANLPVYTRMSEVEREPAWLEKATGVWLDAFDDIWYENCVIDKLLKLNKKVCIVSPELHGRDPFSLWSDLQPLSKKPGLMLCTDWPEVAEEFFDEERHRSHNF